MIHDRRLVILTNDHGPEGIVAAESAAHVSCILGAPVIRLRETSWIKQIETLDRASLCFIATHGGFGEDGTLQQALETRGIRHTHSSSWACANMSNKHLTKLLYLSLSIETPGWYFQGRAYGKENPHSIWVSKPYNGGSKNGLVVSKQPKRQENVLSEVCIAGSLEVSVCVVGHAKPMAFPPLVRGRDVANIGVLAVSTKILPSRVRCLCTEAALNIHRALGAYGVTKTDFILDQEGGPWAIETDAHPALGPMRAAASQARLAGFSYPAFIRLLLNEYVKI